MPWDDFIAPFIARNHDQVFAMFDPYWALIGGADVCIMDKEYVILFKCLGVSHAILQTDI